MRVIKWLGILAALALIIACFMPWVTIPSKNITVSGIDATGTNFGKPGYFHFAALSFFLLFTFLPKIWAKRSNLIVTALNFAWALRNYFIITMCRGGECPEKKIAIYLIVATSLIMLVSSLFPDFKIKK
ncbi:MAG: hypothetical protein Q8941_21890 [Bacteroidota bacterium]|nr:hypothetical protein [Bacteroidota bacterium]